MLKIEPKSVKEYDFSPIVKREERCYRKKFYTSRMRAVSIKKYIEMITGLNFVTKSRVMSLLGIHDYEVNKILNSGCIKYFVIKGRNEKKYVISVIPSDEIPKIKTVLNSDKNYLYDVPGVIEKELSISYREFCELLIKYNIFDDFVFNCLCRGITFEELLDFFYKVAPVSKVRYYIKKRYGKKVRVLPIERFKDDEPDQIIPIERADGKCVHFGLKFQI